MISAERAAELKEKWSDVYNLKKNDVEIIFVDEDYLRAAHPQIKELFSDPFACGCQPRGVNQVFLHRERARSESELHSIFRHEYLGHASISSMDVSDRSDFYTCIGKAIIADPFTNHYYQEHVAGEYGDFRKNSDITTAIQIEELIARIYEEDTPPPSKEQAESVKNKIQGGFDVDADFTFEDIKTYCWLREARILADKVECNPKKLFKREGEPDHSRITAEMKKQDNLAAFARTELLLEPEKNTTLLNDTTLNDDLAVHSKGAELPPLAERIKSIASGLFPDKTLEKPSGATLKK